MAFLVSRISQTRERTVKTPFAIALHIGAAEKLLIDFADVFETANPGHERQGHVGQPFKFVRRAGFFRRWAEITTFVYEDFLTL